MTRFTIPTFVTFDQRNEVTSTEFVAAAVLSARFAYLQAKALELERTRGVIWGNDGSLFLASISLSLSLLLHSS